MAGAISVYIPENIDTFYEPFAGSAAMTIYAAHHNLAKRFILGDTLEPIIELWKNIINNPYKTADQYLLIWNGQQNSDISYFNKIRDRYNQNFDPNDLLYLLCRCVKNAVRFNAVGKFTQSVDKRRLGMSPEKMRAAILGASHLLKGKSELRAGDWLLTTKDASNSDFIYMDPPYFGTSVGPDKRYHKQLHVDDLINGLKSINNKKIRFVLSYDGMTGDKNYGPPLPDSLGMTRILLEAGRSSQSTLHGKADMTVESLYLSAGIKRNNDKTKNHDQLLVSQSLF